jgi:hypothetical protein
LNELRCRLRRGTAGGVELEIIGTKLVNSVYLNVLPAFANPPITSALFASIDLVERAMHSNQEDVERF